MTYETDTNSSTNKNTHVPDFQLGCNYPNPFNQKTTIPFSLPKSGKVAIEVYNVVGQRIATPFIGYKIAGNHCVDFDASNLSSGIYYYFLNTDKFNTFNKMILLK